jgi:peptidoglycan/LPS O-acetylase OafA/YrhL
MEQRSLVGLHLLADHFPPLHGLRSLAIVSVLQVHVSITLAKAGLMFSPIFYFWSLRVWFGMDLFFILSGFLIGTLLLPAADGRAKGSILRFYVRRAFRIVPLYYVVLTALALLQPLQPGQREGLIYEYAYLTNYPVFTAWPVMPWAWSLAVEEHFYLAVPVVAGLLALMPSNAWRMSALVLLWLLGFGVRLATVAAHPGPWNPDLLFLVVYMRTHTRMDILVAGMLLAHVQRHYGPRLREALRRPGLALVFTAVPVLSCAALLGPLAAPPGLRSVFAWGTVTSVMYFALILLLLNTESVVTRCLSSRWFLRFATLGYGVYLVHLPLMAHVVLPAMRAVFVRWHPPIEAMWPLALALLLVLATAVAYLLHLAVEKPALWVRDRLTG